MYSAANHLYGGLDKLSMVPRSIKIRFILRNEPHIHLSGGDDMGRIIYEKTFPKEASAELVSLSDAWNKSRSEVDQDSLSQEF